jgi:zinc D-Ala-D-Ala carboxypeptidase
MKKIKRMILSKQNRVIILVVTGLLIAGIGSLVSAQIFETNNKVFKPVITSNYQPRTKEDIKETEVPSEEKTGQQSQDTGQTAKWPVQLTASEANSLTVVVNKKHKLPSDYVPSLKSVSGAQLRPEAADALGLLLQDANNAGIPMKVLSSYRPYSTQVSTYNRWVAQSGQAAADTFSARPGHSEHQLGLAVDLGEQNRSACDLETCFGDTSAGKWLENNAQEYGFIIRYPRGKDAITGYQYEPWHLRYLRTETAKTVKNSGQTLDQYYGIEAGSY